MLQMDSVRLTKPPHACTHATYLESRNLSFNFCWSSWLRAEFLHFFVHLLKLLLELLMRIVDFNQNLVHHELLRDLLWDQIFCKISSLLKGR
jgi:hypothetical protein